MLDLELLAIFEKIVENRNVRFGEDTSLIRMHSASKNVGKQGFTTTDWPVHFCWGSLALFVPNDSSCQVLLGQYWLIFVLHFSWLIFIRIF